MITAKNHLATHGLTETQIRKRIREYGISGTQGQIDHILGKGPARALGATDDHSPRMGHDLLGKLIIQGWFGGNASADDTGMWRSFPHAMRLVPLFHPCRRRNGFQWLSKREVEMNRPTEDSVGLCIGSCGERFHMPDHDLRFMFVGHGHVYRPAYMIAIQLDLVDGLVCATLPELRRPVGRQYQQWNPGIVRLDNRRKKIRGGGAGRAHQRNRPARPLGQPQCEKGGAAFVKMPVDADAGIGGKCQRQGSRARARRNADLLQPRSHQFVDENRRPSRVRISLEVHCTSFPLLPMRPEWDGTSKPSHPIRDPGRNR